MQAPSGSQRAAQRRAAANVPIGQQQPAAGYASTQSNNSSMQMSPQAGARTNSTSSRSQGYRRGNAQQQLSQIEKSVTHLLVATKQLLETLTQWSRQNATEAEVSDVYVRLGYEFNIATRSFNAIGVETEDLGNVPDLLRTILEETLSQEASPASLDRFLPRIRDIIVNLLHGLKRKQQKLRQKQAKDDAAANAATTTGSSTRQVSLASSASGELASPQIRRSASRDSHASEEATVPPRTSSVQGGRGSPVRPDSGAAASARPYPAPSTAREAPVYKTSQATATSSTSAPSQHASGGPGYMSYEEPRPSASQYGKSGPGATFLPVPPPPPKQQDALAALQRGGDLERRASRRYSAYQISKHLGAPTNGMPMLPSVQHSPVPNRGRDVRESMNAVRTRTSLMASHQRSPNRRPVEAPPARQVDQPPRIPEHDRPDVLESIPDADEGQPSRDSPILKAVTGNRLGQPPTYPALAEDDPNPSLATVESRNAEPRTPSRDKDEHAPANTSVAAGETGITETSKSTAPVVDSPPGADSEPAKAPQSPQPSKELTLFLQYKSRIKKCVLPDGYSQLTMARLQLAFIEAFAWNTHSNGNDLPDIYIQDPVSGVRHELEDLSDVRERSVLVLNVEPLDEVKRHIDEKVSGLGKMVQEIRNVIEAQQTSIQRVSDRQTDAAKDLARLAVPAANRVSFVDTSSAHSAPDQASATKRLSQLNDIQTLRRDLAVMRQTYSGFVADVEASMADIRAKASAVKTVAVDATTPVLNRQGGRAYVNKGKKELADVSDALVNRVDDLQDVVEDLRKDVVSRGVRPLPRQLESVGREIAVATAELKKLQEFLRREKPMWSKIWEQELQVVCDDRDLLTMQEALAADLHDDLESAAETFALVEQATKEQLKDGHGSGSRSASRTLNNGFLDHGVDPHVAKEGVLGDVRALQPNHESRLEAIERAEKARQRELESRRGGEFQKELGSFVQEGRLKKSGGVEEAERQRKARDERIRREMWERENASAKAKEVVGSVTPPSSEKPQAESAGDDKPNGHPSPSQPAQEKDEGNGDGNGDADGDGSVETGGDGGGDDDGDGEEHKKESKRSSWLPSIFGS